MAYLDPNLPLAPTDEGAGAGGYSEATAADQDRQDAYERASAGRAVPLSPGGYAPPSRAAPPMAPPTGLPARTPAAIYAARAAPPLERAQTVGVGEPLQFSFAPPESKSFEWGDYLKIPARGFVGTWKDVLGAVKWTEQQINGDPEMAAHLQRNIDGTSKVMDSLMESMSPAAKQAMSASVTSYFGSNIDDKGNHIPTPGEVGYTNYIKANALNLIPMAFQAVLPETLAARLGLWSLSKMGVIAETAQKVARAGGMAASGATFGATNLGALQNEAFEKLRDTPEKEMYGSPAYRELRAGGWSDEQAKQQLFKTIAPSLGLQGFMLGAAAGAGGAGVLARGAFGAAGRGLLGRAAIGAGEAGAVMGAQGGLDTALQQQAQIGMGTRQDYDIGPMIANAVSAGLPGALMGAVGGALHREPAPRTPSAAVDGGPPPDVAAAITAGLPPAPAPEPPMGPRPLTSGGGQGEMFHPSELGPTVTPGAPPEPPAPERTPFPPSASPIDTSDRTPGPYAPQPPSPMVAGPSVRRARPERPEPGSPVIAAPPGAEGAGMPGATQPEMFASQDLGTAPPRATEVPPAPAPDPAARKAAYEERMRAIEQNLSEREAAKGITPAPPPESTPPVTPGVKLQAPGERPSKGKTKSEMVDVLVGEYGASPTQLKNMSPNDVATRYDREERRKAASTPTPPTSTVEPGVPASRPERSEGLVPPRETVAPPVPETSLPSAPATERPSTAQADLEARMRSSAETLRKTRETVAAGPTEEELATLVDTKQSGKTPEPPVPAEKPAATVSKGRKKQPTVIIPEKKAGPQAYVEREEGASAPSAEELQTDRAKELARSQARDDVEVARKAAMGLLPPSTPIGKAIDKASSDLANLIHRGSDGSRENLVDILHKFTEPVDKRTELEQQAREKLADHYHRKLMGERLVTRTGDEPTRSEASVVREEEQKRGKVDKPTSAEGIEETAVGGGEGESAGLTTSLDTKNKPVTKAHVQERKAADYIQKVLDPTDPMTVEQAQAEFDKQGTVGRPRKADAASLAAALDAEIKRVSNPLLAETHQKQYDEHLRLGAERDLPGAKQQTEARTEAYGKRTKILEDRLAQVAPERIAALKEARARIVDPVGTVADQAQAMATRAAFRESLAKRGGGDEIVDKAPPRVDGISPLSSRFVRNMVDTRLDNNLNALWRKKHENGEQFTTHDAYRQIANDPLLAVEAAPFRSLAHWLLNNAPDIPVYRPAEAFMGDHITLQQYKDFGDAVGAAYIPRSPEWNAQPTRVLLRSNEVSTLLHEGFHTVTTNYVHWLADNMPNHPHMDALRVIQRELASQLRNASDINDHVAGSVHYATTNVKELHTMLMTDPEVQAFAASRQMSQYAIGELARLGFRPSAPTSSIWRSFVTWTREALGLGVPKSASEYTLFDHILKPVTEISDAAAEYNRRFVMPKDPGLRERAEPLIRATSTLAATGQDLLRRTDPAGFGDRMRRYILRVSNRDAVVDWNKDILPSLLNYRTADENIRAGSNTFAGKYGDKVQELAGRINKADNKNGLGNLMTDVGIHDVSVGSALAADANSHLTTDAQRTARDRLQGQYDALSAKDKATYDEVKKLYNDMYTDERHAQAEALINGFMPKATDEQRAAFTTVVKSHASLEKFLADPNNSRVAEAFGADWGTSRAVAINLAKLHDMGFVRGDYFPLRRFGNYVVRYGDKTDPANYGVEMFESYKKAQERRAELAKDRDDVMQVSRKDTTPLADLASRPALADELESSMRRAGMDAAHIDHVTNMMNDILLRHATHSEAARARMARKGVRGASVDHTRVLASDFVSRQARYGYLLHGLDRARRLNEMHDEARAHEGPTGVPGAAVRAMNVYEEMVRRQTQPGDHDNLAYKISATANAFSFAQSLQSVSHMLTGTMETHGNSLALLGARHGYTRTVIALSKAMADASPVIKGGAVNTIKALGNRLKMSDWNLVKAVVEEMASKPGANRAAIMALGDELVRTGLIDHTQLQDIRQQMNPADLVGTGANKVWNIFYNSHAAMAHAVDVMNKLAVAKAAYDLELRKSGDHKVARDYAIQMTRRVMPNYTVGNRAGIAQGPLASSLLQFKRYGMHMYALMANLIHETARGPNKVESAKALAGILATHAAMAGVLTLIADPLRYIGGGIDILNRRAKFHDYQNDVRGFLASTLGPTMGEIAARGLPHALGMDLHRRVGLSNLLEVPEMNGFNKEGAAQVMLGLATGATGENLQNLVDGVGKLTHGDWGGFLKAAAPRPFRDVYKGIDAATEGIKDKTGKVILPASRVGVTGGILQGLGIQPAAVSEFREGRNAVLEAREEQRSEHTDLVNRWLAASPTDRAAIMTKIRQFNADPMNQGARITMDSLIRTQQQRRKDENQAGGFGLRLPKVGARQLMQAGAFANVQ